MKQKNLPKTTRSFSVTKYFDNESSEQQIEVVVEQPFQILVNDDAIATVMVSPSNLKEFLIGFIVGQGIASKKAQIERTLIDIEKGLLWAKVVDPAKIDLTKTLITSGCSGGISFDNFQDLKQVNKPEQIFDISFLSEMMKKMISGGDIYKKSGGVHSAALVNNKDIIFQVEDIGRHNCLDKIIGYLVDKELDPKDMIVITTGRLSIEAIAKIARSGIRTLGSRSTPTALAVDLARKINIALYGYIRSAKATRYN